MTKIATKTQDIETPNYLGYDLPIYIPTPNPLSSTPMYRRQQHGPSVAANRNENNSTKEKKMLRERQSNDQEESSSSCNKHSPPKKLASTSEAPLTTGMPDTLYPLPFVAA
jgi:hypothetical protein